MDSYSIIQSLFQTSEKELLRFEELVLDRNYTTEVLSFMDNYSRILNYWGGDINILPPNDMPGKRKCYSFSDLIWLYLVKQLRDFGMEKEPIQNLKNDLYGIVDVKATNDQILEKRNEIEATIQKLGADPNYAQKIVDSILSNQKNTEQIREKALTSYILICLGFRLRTYLLINKEGNHQIFIEYQFSNWMATNKKFSSMFRGPHISLCLNDAIAHFISIPEIKDDIRENFFTHQEWKIISLIREKKPLSVTIQFDENGDSKTIEVTKKVYLSLEQRLLETMAKNAYGSIKVIFENGKAVYATQAEKHKLNKK